MKTVLDIDRVQEQFPGRILLWTESTDSTMLDAASLAAGGCPSGTVVGTEEQKSGQGRLGRSWHSEKGSGLYFSVVLWVPLPPEELPILTMAAGLAVAEAITQVTGVPVDLRWPNDILIGERKVCGILIQQHHQALVCGIGINCEQTAFPAELRDLAASLRMTTGRQVDREALLCAVLESLDRHVELLRTQGKSAVLRLFTAASSYVSGRRVVVDQLDQQLRGVTAGLDENGFLQLELDNGKRALIIAGGVRPE